LRLLVDQNLPRRLVPLLESAGHDVMHTEDANLAKSSDPQIMTWCCAEGRVLLTADKKLTKFFALRLLRARASWSLAIFGSCRPDCSTLDRQSAAG
jgi:predicted nuclease of predicted toxin-antitoxin system